MAFLLYTCSCRLNSEHELVRIAQESLQDGAAQTVDLLDIAPLLLTEAHNLLGAKPTVVEHSAITSVEPSPSCSSSGVDPWMSVKSNVTVPIGR
jgi:hypothetical protein